MVIVSIMSKIFSDKIETMKFIAEIIIIYVIIKYRHKVKKSIIDLPNNTVDNLIHEFKPEPLTNTKVNKWLFKREFNPNYLDLSSYDIFCISKKYKKKYKKIIKEYGIGTCNPPSFFGRLDLHLQLEQKISEILGTESSVLYANSYACVHSVISCFSTACDNIFYFKYSNESIFRGVKLSKSNSFEFTNINSLESLIKLYNNTKVRNFVVIEGLSKNTGSILDLPNLIKLKSIYNLKLIIDESLSIPLLHKKGICGYFNIDPKVIDIRIGSFSYGFSCSGGFYSGPNDLAQYQKLSSSSYVFSASMPAYLAYFNLKVLDDTFSPTKQLSKVAKFHKYFNSETYKIVSDKLSPIIIIRKKQLANDVEVCIEAYRIYNELYKEKIYVGLNHNPVTSIRILLKRNTKNIVKIAKLIALTCDK